MKPPKPETSAPSAALLLALALSGCDKPETPWEYSIIACKPTEAKPTRYPYMLSSPSGIVINTMQECQEATKFEVTANTQSFRDCNKTQRMMEEVYSALPYNERIVIICYPTRPVPHERKSR